MINYKLLKENGITPKTIKKINNSYLVETTNNKYIIKERNKDLKNKFNYLLSRGFTYFPNYTFVEDYDIYDFVEDITISEEEKLEELINLLSLLHTKTTRYKKVDIDDYKIIYEDLNNKIEQLNNYYIELNNLIDSKIYMSPSHYLLVLNISKIYSALSFCKEELDNWYELIKTTPKQRIAFIHNNPDTSHIIRNKNPYLISFNKSKLGMPIEDLLILYNKYSKNNNFDILLDNYQKRYPLKEEELKLFFIQISIPDEIKFTQDELNNTIQVKNTLEKLIYSDKLIRPYYENKPT